MLTEIKFNSPTDGTHLHDFATEMVAQSNRSGCRVSGKFNDTLLHADPGDSYQDVIDIWQAVRDERREAWESSPEGQLVDKLERWIRRRVTNLRSQYDERVGQ